MNWLTHDLPGIGGEYKLCPEDFFVEEIPLYPCRGTGEHLYLQIEKRGLTTSAILQQISATLKLSERDIGYAGLKDARAVTRQWISLPGSVEKKLVVLEQLPLTILQVERHTNKLRLGHLAGNRFRLRVRRPVAEAKQRADQIFARLIQAGVPNRFGEQRYGMFGNSHKLGRFLLKAEYEQLCHELIGDPSRIEDPRWKQSAELFRQGKFAAAAHNLPTRMRNEKLLLEHLAKGKSQKAAVLTLPKRLLRLYLSALQSSLFDQLLQQRLPELSCLRAGDLALKHANGACFVVDDPLKEQPRADRFEISPTAPLFGSKVILAQQIPGQQERDLLKANGLKTIDWKLGGGLTMTGERRALRVPLSGVSTTEIAADLQLNFCLPRGSYATSVLHELIKKQPAA